LGAGLVLGKEVFDLGLGHVAAEGVFEFVLEIAFGGILANPDGPGLDAIGAKLLGKRDFCKGFAPGHFFPRPFGWHAV